MNIPSLSRKYNPSMSMDKVELSRRAADCGWALGRNSGRVRKRCVALGLRANNPLTPQESAR
jgi:hypothetical protein